MPSAVERLAPPRRPRAPRSSASGARRPDRARPQPGRLERECRAARAASAISVARRASARIARLARRLEVGARGQRRLAALQRDVADQQPVHELGGEAVVCRRRRPAPARGAPAGGSGAGRWRRRRRETPAAAIAAAAAKAMRRNGARNAWIGSADRDARLAAAVRVAAGAVDLRLYSAAQQISASAAPRPSPARRSPMPELPEVETTRRGVAPHVVGRRVAALHRVRPPLALAGSRRPRASDSSAGRSTRSTGAASTCSSASATDTLLVHLGMTGSLRVFTRAPPRAPHDHVDIVLDDGIDAALSRPAALRRDALAAGPRRRASAARARSGPEPFDRGVRRRLPVARDARAARRPIKLALMDNHLVVGVGNIYANESLFRAGIRPTTPRATASRGARLARLVDEVRATLREAIAKGGARCATTSTRAASPAISSSTTSSTAARASPAGSAARAIRHRSGWAAGRRSTARDASADAPRRRTP